MVTRTTSGRRLGNGSRPLSSFVCREMSAASIVPGRYIGQDQSIIETIPMYISTEGRRPDRSSSRRSSRNDSGTRQGTWRRARGRKGLQHRLGNARRPRSPVSCHIVPPIHTKMPTDAAGRWRPAAECPVCRVDTLRRAATLHKTRDANPQIDCMRPPRKRTAIIRRRRPRRDTSQNGCDILCSSGITVGHFGRSHRLGNIVIVSF